MSHEPDHAFRVRAILWLHSHMNLQTSVLPTHRVEDERGRGRLKAFAIRTNRGNDLMFVALCLFVVAAFFAMIASRPDVQGIRRAITVIEWIGLVGGTALAVLGTARYRRARERILVELRLSMPHQQPVDVRAIDDLRRDAGSSPAWMLSEVPYTSTALEAAGRSNVRCFLHREGGFVELTSEGEEVVALPTRSMGEIGVGGPGAPPHPA